MVALIQFAYFIVNALLSAVVIVIIAWVIAGWLVFFEVLNMRNRTARAIVDMLDRIVTPIMRPLRRIVPPLGGLDLTPFLVLLVITGMQNYLLPAFFGWLMTLVAGPAMGTATIG
ncbi:MAG TPA: YggT family protein [Caulobacteraceae bacterium]|jgi:YggT family protein